MKIILFTNARDESHLKEWAAHHLLMGFDHIVIFDHKSKRPISTDFARFDKRVRVINCGHMQGAVKMPLMQLAATVAKEVAADWMLYLDADEFLVINPQPPVNKINGIKNFMALYTNPSIDQLAVNWLMYGTNNLVEELDLSRGELIMERYTKSDEYLSNHVKCFVRPEKVISATNPHFFNILDPHKAVGIDGRTFSPPFHDVGGGQRPFFTAPIYIAHYVYQSENTYRKRKVNLPRDDNGTMRGAGGASMTAIHTQYNTRDNFLAARKYGPRTLAFLRTHGVVVS